MKVGSNLYYWCRWMKISIFVQRGILKNDTPSRGSQLNWQDVSCRQYYRFLVDYLVFARIPRTLYRRVLVRWHNLGGIKIPKNFGIGSRHFTWWYPHVGTIITLLSNLPNPYQHESIQDSQKPNLFMRQY